MVIKTEVCHFSGLKLYPGHGTKYIRTDAKTFLFFGTKQSKSYKQRRNPRKLPWTQLYRRMHKKGVEENTGRKKIRRANKVQREIVGASLDVIKAKRNQKPEQRQAMREAALREIKERNRSKQAAKKSTAKAAAPKTKAAVKNVKAPNPSKSKGGKR